MAEGIRANKVYGLRHKHLKVRPMMSFSPTIGKATAIVMHATKLSKTVSAAAPALAPVLGIVSGVFGFIFNKPAGPTAKDILKGTNLAIAELTKHLNKKIDLMKGELLIMFVMNYSPFSNCTPPTPFFRKFTARFSTIPCPQTSIMRRKILRTPISLPSIPTP